ncbi:MAG: hypothetical protein U1C97_00985, partial [Candidatus Gracilibacteria bacterium]|nr:hypothetical protein [Candidatus Gracilibacteria bacterium]
MIFKKTITGLLSLSILLSITVMPSAMAQNQTVIPAAQNQNLTDQRLKDVTNFLNEYNISRCISRRQGPNEAIIAFYAICSILQVYDQNDLGRAKAWEKAESIKLIPPGLEKADELTALEFLDLLFHAAGITISPVT